jgi:hypothetical protein
VSGRHSSPRGPDWLRRLRERRAAVAALDEANAQAHADDLRALGAAGHPTGDQDGPTLPELPPVGRHGKRRTGRLARSGNHLKAAS